MFIRDWVKELKKDLIENSTDLICDLYDEEDKYWPFYLYKKELKINVANKLFFLFLVAPNIINFNIIEKIYLWGIIKNICYDFANNERNKKMNLKRIKKILNRK